MYMSPKINCKGLLHKWIDSLDYGFIILETYTI